MLLVSFLVVILLRGSDGLKLPGIGSIFDLDGYYELVKEVVSKGQFAADRGEAINLFDDRCEVMLGELLNKVDEISQKLDSMEKHVINKLEGLEHIVLGIADDVQKKYLMHKVIDAMKIIFDKHDEFIKFAKRKKKPYKKYIKFLQDIVSSGSEGLGGELKKIHRMVVRGRRTSSIEETVLDLMENVFNAKNGERCDEISPQHSLYMLYTTIATAEMTAFATIVYSLKILEPEIKNNDTDIEIELVTESIQERMKDYAKSFHDSMKRVERSFRSCDPKKSGHVRDETFTEMWGLIQVVVINEWGLIYKDSCSDTCENMYGYRPNSDECFYGPEKSVKWRRNGPEDLEKCPSPRKCYGLISNCRSLSFSNYCKLKNSTRRYDFIQDSYNDGKLYGAWTDCKNGVYSHFDWDYPRDSTYGCTDCMCLCHDDRPASISVHVVNLRESASQHKYNRVVVGVRFKVEGRVLQIQVQEAEILPEYSIDLETLQWVYLPKIGREIELVSNSVQLQKDPDSVKGGRDYHIFLAKHAFNMNKVLLKDRRVVVGVRFVKAHKQEVEEVHIEIQVKSMEYNPVTGKLIQGSEKWEGSDVIHNSRLDIEAKLPQSAETITRIKSGSNHYVQMRGSDWEEDAGQTTLPLFDAHAVETKPLSPLGGLGMHYRAADEEAGFIGLSGYSLDYVGFLDNSKENESPDPEEVVGPL